MGGCHCVGWDPKMKTPSWGVFLLPGIGVRGPNGASVAKPRAEPSGSASLSSSAEARCAKRRADAGRLPRGGRLNHAKGDAGRLVEEADARTARRLRRPCGFSVPGGGRSSSPADPSARAIRPRDLVSSREWDLKAPRCKGERIIFEIPQPCYLLRNRRFWCDFVNPVFPLVDRGRTLRAIFYIDVVE